MGEIFVEKTSADCQLEMWAGPYYAYPAQRFSDKTCRRRQYWEIVKVFTHESFQLYSICSRNALLN